MTPKRSDIDRRSLSSREQAHASLLQQLSATRAEADHLKRRAILADQALEELAKSVQGVAGKLEDVRLPDAPPEDATMAGTS